MMQNQQKTPPPDKCRHLWKYNRNRGLYECMNCDDTCEYYCYNCDEPIAKKDIPKEAFEKISSLIYYHEKCRQKEMLQNTREEVLEYLHKQGFTFKGKKLVSPK